MADDDLLHKQDVSASPIDRFRSFTVAHPRLVEAKETLMNAIHGAEPNSLIFVFGPTGVGKTTLRMKAEHLIDTELLDELHQEHRSKSGDFHCVHTVHNSSALCPTHRGGSAFECKGSFVRTANRRRLARDLWPPSGTIA